MRIALDAMGSDHAPGPEVEGAVQAARAVEDVEVVLVGDQRVIEPLLERVPVPVPSGDGVRAGDPEAWRRRLSIVHASEVVGMHEKPTEALRRKPDSSIAGCWRLMAGREVDAVVSAGNTGAVVAAGLRTRLFLRGVKRPGIAVVLPCTSGHCVLLDVGANPGCKPEHLYQYGVMGAVYARNVLKIPNPTVGLMNIGSEDAKGNDLVRDAHQLLQTSPLKDCYVGNIEGRDLYQGVADVVVCDGFVGNVVLKVSEGMTDIVLRQCAQEVFEQLESPAERERARAAFQAFARRYDYSEFGGAPLLGIDGVCIICHGSSGARAICNALRLASSFVHRHLNEQIVDRLRLALT